jgi:transposase
MVCPAIDKSTSCEIRAVTAFFTPKNTSAAEIHREFCAVCDQNIMSKGTVRQWCRMFKNRRTRVHDEERSGGPSVASDDLVRNVDQKIVKEEASQFQNFRVNFHKIHALS